MNAFTKENILETLKQWYDGFDTHAPIEHYTNLLTDEQLFIDLPPVPKTNFEEFATWYASNNQTFFDGKHTLHEIDMHWEEDHATVVIPLHWTVRTWAPPAAHSTQLNLDMIATIILVPDDQTGKPRIQRYTVKE